jgi:hypothetical protein
MNFWETIIPALILLMPLLAIAALLLWTDKFKYMEIRASLILGASLVATSILGFFQFQQAFTLALETGLPVSSSEFELALSFDVVRMSWVFFSSLILFSVAIYDGEQIYKSGSSSLRFIFLAGISLFSSLAFLSEKIVLSIMFIEITAFLLHAFSIHSGGEEGRLDRVSYFKRGAFIFLGLSAMLFLSFFDDFNTMAIVLMGVILYIMSLVFSKHNYLDWQYLPLSLLQSGAAFFLLGRLMRVEMAPELWIPFAVLFAVAATIFSSISIATLSVLNSYFWLTSALISYMLFKRFLSVTPYAPEWGMYEASGLLGMLSLTCLVRYGAIMSGAIKRSITLILCALVMSIIFGIMPGIGLPLPSFETQMWRLVIYCALTFLFAVACTKTIAISFINKINKQNKIENIYLAWLPAVFSLISYWGLGIAKESNFEIFLNSFTADIFSNYSWISIGSSALLGFVAGLVIGFNEKFISWSKNRQQKMEDFVPRVDPIIIRWNEQLVAFPEKIVSLLLVKSGRVGGLFAVTLSKTDDALLGRGVRDSVVRYSIIISSFLRRAHSGSIRAYIYYAFVSILLAALIFLKGVL